MVKNRSKIVSAYLLFVTVASLTGCYYDNEAVLYPEAACQPVPAPTFTTDVLPLLNSRCHNCHSGSSPSASIRLDTYIEIKKSVDNGGLMGSIHHDTGFSPMPKNATKMRACEIQKIQDWITQGTQNN